MKKLTKKDCGRFIRTHWHDIGAIDGVLVEVDESGNGKFFAFSGRSLWSFRRDQVISKGKYVTTEDTGLNSQER